MSGNDKPTALSAPADEAPRRDDEGGLRAPPHLHGWRKAWWWFDFIILVKLARLRFIGILIVIGVIITQWDTLTAWYDKWTRPATAADTGRGDFEYFCPMHPSVVRDNPKEKCPICFMPLSKRKTGQSNVEPLPAGVVNRVQLSPYRMVLAGVETWPVDFVPLAKEIAAVGYIEFDERGQRTVSARVAGRIDKLVVNETGQMVHAGDELALLYSPDLLVTVQNLRNAQRTNNRENLESAKTRLELLGIDDVQIADILAADETDIHLRIRSPISGHVITKYVREGQYVEEGTPLYDVADLSTVWIQAQVYEEDLAFLPSGYEHGPMAAGASGLDVSATTRALPGQTFHGKLAFIYPHVDQDTRTVTVRFELDNPGHKLRPGGTATVTLRVQPQQLAMLTGSAENTAQQTDMLAEGRVLAVPESAVIDTGNDRIIYREASPGVYEGVQVALAPSMTGPDGAVFYPLLRGLEPGKSIVTNGSFLVDAETRLNPAAGSIYFGGSSGAQDKSSNVTTVRPSTPEDPEVKVQAALANLPPEDRALAEAQRFCPILPDNLLGSMGTPVKLTVGGQPVFVCCSGCKKEAQANAKETLRKVEALKANSQPARTSRQNKGPTAPVGDEEADIAAALALLPVADRTLAEAQRFCPILKGSRLGSMGMPHKIVVDGQPVFLCCEGCEQEALDDPGHTLAKVKQLQTQKAPRDAQ